MLGSVEYAAQLAEVRELGEDDSGVRTPEQTEIAFFWANDLDGTYKPPGQLFEITKRVSDQKGLTLAENARLFALVAFAMADAGIFAWDAKYDTRLDLWRPETAIREDATDPDEGWDPLLAVKPADAPDASRRRFRRTSRAMRRSARRTPRSCAASSAPTT